MVIYEDLLNLKEYKSVLGQNELKSSPVSEKLAKALIDKIIEYIKLRVIKNKEKEYEEFNMELSYLINYQELLLDKVSLLIDNKVINKYKTRNLTILKEVLDVSSNKSFEFEIEATYRGKSLDGTYKILKNGIEGIIKFENGKATFLLKHNEKIEFKDLPYDIKYKIKEINSEGFVVKYQVNDGEIKLFDINNINENILGEDTNIKFINSSGYEMPATGSSGMLILIIMGSLLSAIPVIYISISVLKKKADY